MLWDKKVRPASPPETQLDHPPAIPVPAPFPSATPKLEVPMPESAASRMPSPIPSSSSHSTVLGGTLVLKGELSGKEDLLIEGQFDGSVDVPEHCLTVGPQGHVKADIRARQVIVNGSVDGKVTAKDKVELHKTANVVGDLVSASVSIDDGAYFKGSIEIVRETGVERPRSQPAQAAQPGHTGHAGTGKSAAISTVA